jgi:hypothetical protein
MLMNKQLFLIGNQGKWFPKMESTTDEDARKTVEMAAKDIE